MTCRSCERCDLSFTTMRALRDACASSCRCLCCCFEVVWWLSDSIVAAGGLGCVAAVVPVVLGCSIQVVATCCSVREGRSSD